MANRLNLNFKLNSAEERLNYINDYLDPCYVGDKITTYSTKRYPFPFPYEPTSDELEMMANYVLWGKTKPSAHFPEIKNNESVVDAKYIDIPVRNSPWNRKDEDSLHEMIEQSSETGRPIEVQHSLLSGIDGKREPQARYRFPKETFSRARTREQLRKQPRLLLEYEALWKRIDEVDYAITTYQITSGKREKPIREELEKRLTEEEKRAAREHAATLNLHTWGKLRRQLVELRRQQYYLRDSFSPTIGRPRLRHYTSETTTGPLEFQDVLPCGVHNASSNFSQLLFYGELSEKHFDANFQRKLRQYLLNYEEPEGNYLDFRDLDHVSLFIYAIKDLKPDREMEYSQREYMTQTIATFMYYVEAARLEEMHKEILYMKADGKTNGQIASYINKKYNKTYSPNYISTIFRAKCCKEINAAAEMHYNVLCALTEGESRFKRCNSCQRLLLRSPDNFVRKARARDGLTTRCKACDKIARYRAN